MTVNLPVENYCKPVEKPVENYANCGKIVFHRHKQ
jgi:hypothetical protein